MTHFRQLAFAGLSTAVAALATTTNASADSVRGFGSLLVYPVVDNSRADQTFLTLTNHSNSTSVIVEYVYINAVDCLETNRTRTLTPNDTLTVDARFDSGNAGAPSIVNGYCYVFAKNAAGQAISFNNLSGSAVVLEGGTASSFAPDPVIYRAIPAQGAVTNLDNDVYRDLNGTEYEQTSDEIHIPHFIAAGNSKILTSSPELVLLSLTGGYNFQAIINFLVYNDNEEPFSAQANFRCWRRSPLTAYSGIFSSSFLASTNDAASESTLGFETGWYKMEGNVTTSGSSLPGGTATDPAFIAVHINRVSVAWESATWVVPSYGVGEQNNGDLQAALGNVLD